jgi:hypothetical protein
MTERRMSIRRLGFTALFLGVSGLAMTLSGCGGDGAQEKTSSGEVKIAPVENPKGESLPVNEEFKKLSPAGKAAGK